MPTPTPKLRELAYSQLLVGAVCALVPMFFGRIQLGASIGVGATLMLFNILLLGWAWQRSFDKKSIAWTSMIIVIKYAVLLGSIFYLARTSWFLPLGAGIGIFSFIFAALLLAAFYHFLGSTLGSKLKQRD